MKQGEARARVIIKSREYLLGREERLVFGRGGNPADDVVALDSSDMGISAQAGSVDYDAGRWVVTNRSRKRPLLIHAPSSQGPVRLNCGRNYAICDASVVVIVVGLNYKHQIEVRVPESEVRTKLAATGTEGQTVAARELCNEADLDALTAIFRGYLEPAPRDDRKPLSYRQAAALLDIPEHALSKRIENLRARIKREGLAELQGDQALYELADFVLNHGVISPADLDRLRSHKLQQAAPPFRPMTSPGSGQQRNRP